MNTSLLLLLAALLLAQHQGATADEHAKWLSVHGKMLVPEGSSLAQAELALQLEDGRRLLTFPLQDGSFSFPEVPLGVHTLSVDLLGLIYPTLKLDVGASRRGKVAATAVDVQGAPAMPYPLLLRPFSRMEYFEKRQPFSILGFLRTPYGMMVGFMIFSVFILPKLKIDPEEYKEMMEEREREKEKTTATLASAVAGAGSGGTTRRRND